MNKKSAIFFDRDGTIIYNKINRPAHNKSEVVLIPGVREALYKAKYVLGYKLFLFTNQAGIAHGHVTLEGVKEVNAEMCRQLALFDEIPFDDICIASESQKQLEYQYNLYGKDWSKVSCFRKPSPYYINNIIKDYNLNKEGCFMVGDDPKDMRAAANAGIKGAAVCSGLTTYETWKEKALTPHIFPSIVEFVDYLETIQTI